jgi:hypothetical protein
LGSSLTPEYGALLAAVEAGDATFLGEHIERDGVKVVAVSVGRAQNPAIGISHGFFTTVLRDYKDWRLKWWREAIQNSVDAGATKIHCKVVYNQDSTVSVSVEDNGSGMDEDVLINKFLMLGGTTKVSGATAGGFGKAKELLILPWVSWRLHTRDIVVDGDGVQYTISHGAMLNGTRIEVVMAADEHTDSAPALAFISKCYLPNIRFDVHEVYADGGEERWKPKANLRGTDLVLDIPEKAEVYLAKVKYDSREVLIRVKGLYMFGEHAPSLPKKQVIAEITAPSIKIFTANRDGFQDWEVSSAISKLTEIMSKDVLSAFRSRKGLIRKKYEGEGKFRADEREAAALARIGPIPPTENGATSPSLEYVADGMTNQLLALELLGSVTYKGAHHVSAAVRQLVWQPDFFVINEIEGFRVPKKFLPESMRPRIVKLIRTWTELCRFVLMQLGEFRPFGVGFLFGEETAASYLREESEEWLLLNPYVELAERRTTWSPTKKSDLQWLYAAAVHECTHLADGISYHDESFAAALTRNLARTADGFRKVRKIVDSIRMTDVPVADTRPRNPATRTHVAAVKNRLLDYTP